MSFDSQSNNKRIAKNTLLLYLRMLFLLVLNLYTSRVILQVLGVENYGIYNVVGGIVVVFSFLNGAMTSSTQRFLNYDLAKEDIAELRNTFFTAVTIHILIALAILLLSETLGLWFLNVKMNIPDERMIAANVVFQCSIITMMVNIISVPYNALIIAHERMSAFAYISIIEAILKLTVVYLLYISSFDKLIVYAVLLAIISFVIRYIYTRYCKNKFEESHFKFKIDCLQKDKLKKMGSFAGWNMFGNLALICVTQGLNILLNLFFGPVVNAARAVAVQVQGTVQQFSANFQTALNPQIVKSYAKSNFDYLYSLLYRGCKFSFFVVLIFALPLFLTADEVLCLWLKTPPAQSAEFLQVIMLTSLIDCLSNPLNNVINATGRIKSFQIINGILMLSVVPVSYILLLFINNALIVFIIQGCFTLITHFVKLRFVNTLIGMPVVSYVRNVYVPIMAVMTLSCILPLWYHVNASNNIISFFLTCAICELSIFGSVFSFGLDNNERKMILSKLKNAIKK